MTDLNVSLTATDDLSPVIARVREQFAELREIYTRLSAEMSKSGGLSAGVEELNRVVQSATSGLVKAISAGVDAAEEYITESAKNTAGNIAAIEQQITRGKEREAQQRLQIIDRLAQAEIDEWSKADAQRLANAEKLLAQENAMRVSAFEKRIASEKAAAKAEFDYEMDLSDRKYKALHNQIEEGRKLQAQFGRDPQRGEVEQTVIKQMESEQKLVQDRVHWLDQYEQHRRQFSEADLAATRFQETAEKELANTRILGMQQAESELDKFDAKLAKVGQGGAGAGGGGGGILGGFGGFDFSGGMKALGSLGGAGGGLLGVLGGAGDLLGKLVGGIGSVAGALGNVLLAPVQLIGGAFDAIGSAVKGATGEIGQFIQVGLGVYGVYEVVNTLQRGIGQLIETIVGLQTKLTQIQALTANTSKSTAADFDLIRHSIADIAMTTGRPMVELGQGLFFIESHGYDAAESLHILGEAAKLSAAGLGTTDQIIRVVVGQMRQYGATVDETTHFMDVFAKTEQQSSLPIGELSTQMARLTPLAAAMQIPVEQVGAAIAQISRSGLPAGRVLTDLIAVVNSFIKPTDDARAALVGMGTSIEEVRKKFQTEGFFATLKGLWDASRHDLDAMGRVLGDRSRAMIGFLALMNDNAKDYKDILDALNAASGTAAKAFEVTQMSIERQVERTSRIFEAYGIVVTENVLPGITAAWMDFNNALQQGDISKAFEIAVTTISSLGDTIISTLGDLANQMFGSGVNIITELARGVMAATQQVLFYAVNFAADLIAGFLLGASPPAKGPLHDIEKGVMAWNQAYATAMLEGGMVLGGTAERVAGTVNEQLAKIGTVGAAGTRAGIEAQIAELDRLLLPWQMAVDQINEKYNAILHPLERQIEMIKNIKDLEYERNQLIFERQDVELAGLKIRAEGDPVKRAALMGQLERTRLAGERISIDQQIAALRRRSAELGKSKMTPQERALEAASIANDLQKLGIQKQLFDLKDQGAAVEYAAGKEKLDADKAAAALEHQAFELQKKEVLLPLEQEHDKIKGQMQEELDYIKLQTDAYEDQKKMLQSILRGMPAAKGGGAGGGAGGTPWQLPDPEEIAAQRRKNQEEFVGGVADTLRQRLLGGISVFFEQHGKVIGQTIMGAVAGGMVAGLPGAFLGAQLVPKLIEEINKRGVTAGDFEAFVTNVKTGVGAAFAKVQPFLAVGDIVGAVSALQADAKKWTDDFWKMMFREFATIPVEAGIVTETAQGYQTAIEKQFQEVPVGTEGSSRYTGLGRSIIEMLFGQQDANLNQEIAAKMINEKIVQPVRRALDQMWTDFTKPEVLEEYIGGPVVSVGPSNAEKLGTAIFGSINAALDWMGQNLGPLSQKLGQALTAAIKGAADFMTTNEEAKQTLSKVFNDIGVQMGAPLAQGLITGIWQAGPETGPAHMPGPELARAIGNVPKPSLQSPNAPSAVAGRALDWVKNLVGGAKDWVGGKEGQEQLSGVGQGMASGVAAGVTDDTSKTAINTAAQTMIDTFETDAKTAAHMHSPAEIMVPIGQGLVEGLNKGILDSGMLTGPIVVTWLDNEVIAQARAILLGAGDPNAGLGGIATQGVNDINNVFAAGVPGNLANSLASFGQSIVNIIMAPIKGSNGLHAQMQHEIDTMPKAPSPAPAGAPPPGADTGTGDTSSPGAPPDMPGEAHAAGANFVVGPHGTDTEYRGMWLTPGERVQVTPAGEVSGAGGGGGAGSGDIHFNAPLIHVENMSGDGGDLDNMLDRVRAFIVNDIRVARGQGVSRPGGVTPRGAR